MAISGAEDDPLASISGADSGSGDECFPDDRGNETDCTSVCDDDVGKDGLTDVLEGDHSWLLRGLADALKDDGDWLRNEEEYPPEHYIEEEANLDPSRLRQRRYSPRTQEKLDWVKGHWEQYCKFVRRDLAQAYDTLTIQSLKGFLSWVCDRRRGKNGRRRGIKRLSSLETFWKWYQLVYKCEAGKRIDEMIIKQSQDLLKLIADEKHLSREKREKATMYVQDLAELCRVLLATTEMLFLIGWLRIQVILFCQLAGYTGNRPQALLELRYRHLQLTLVRDPGSEHPRLVIELTAEFTKGFLGMKDANTFRLPEVIYDPTLVLSPHVLLLGMLFHIKAFESPNVDCPENLYSLNVLQSLNEQRLPLREDLADKYVFCEAIQQGEIVKLAHEIQYTYNKLKYRMKKGGEITGFSQVVKPYVLRNGAGKAFNASPDVSEPLQNLILQHSRIDTFLKHYLDRNITADVLSIYRGLEPQKAIMDMLCSMSRSIDPRRPWKLTTQESRSVNNLPRIKILQANVDALKNIRDKAASKQYEIWDDRLKEAQRQLLNEKQRARSQLKRDKLDRYNREQPVIDSERQLSGKIVDEEVKSALEQTEYMSPEQLELIDAILTLPGRSWEAEQQRRINAINKVTMYCGVEEGSLCFRSPAQPGLTISASISIERPLTQSPELPVQKAIRIVMKEKRPTICFLCLQNPKLPESQRIYSFKRPGELTRHFERKHLSKFQRLICEHCHIAIDTLADLLNHAESSHGTVTRNPKYKKLCSPLY